MAKVKIQGNASGTGVLTISAPNTNDNSTLTLPDATGTIVSANSAGNVGIGVVPESSYTDRPVLRIGSGLGLMCRASGNPSHTWINSNCYQDPSTADDKYIGTDEASQISQTNGAFNFKVASSGTADAAISWTTAMTIANDGNVEISTFSPSGGSVGFATAMTAEPRMHSSASQTSNADHYKFYNPNGECGKIRTNGSATSYNTSSDYRLKENVVPMTGSIDRLKTLKPSRFNFIADADTTVDGFLAHEAQEVVPEAITGTKDAMMTEEYEVTPAVMDGENVVTEAVMGEREVPDMQGIDQSKLVPLLVASLQEAIAKIEELTTRIETLEVI